jgi:hypothetical protein
MIFIKEENVYSPDFFQLYFEKEQLIHRDKMRRDGTDGTGQESAGYGTGWDFKRRTERDGIRRDKKMRDTGRDGTTFWSSRGALCTIITNKNKSA